MSQAFEMTIAMWR